MRKSEQYKFDGKNLYCPTFGCPTILKGMGGARQMQCTDRPADSMTQNSSHAEFNTVFFFYWGSCQSVSSHDP